MKQSNILVTGGAGFIGTNFIRHLFRNVGFEGRVINLDKLTYAGNPMNLADIAEEYGDRYVFARVDIVDRDRVARLLDDHEIDIICHFAAESHVDRSIVDPGVFIQTNVVGTYALLELARERVDRVRHFHHVSTDEVYGSLESGGYFREDTPYQPNSPYSASKAASDHLVRAYSATYGLPVTISNCSNNYGPYQFPEKLMPLMIVNALEGKPLPVYGDGRNVRDWLYVTDHCRAVWTTIEKGEKGRTYNIGGRNEMPNIRVVETVCDLVDELAPPLGNGKPRRSLVTFVKDRPGHDRRYAIDCTRIENELGWTPQESFETGIRKTVQWYLDNPQWVDTVRSGEYQRWIRTHYGNAASET